MTVVNFSHAVSGEQRSTIETLAGRTIERVIDVGAQFDEAWPFAEQAAGLVDQAGLSAKEWQTLPLLVCLPELSTITAAVLAELHGRMGYFTSVVRRRRVGGSSPVVFEGAEIVSLQEVREEARGRRHTGREETTK